MNLKILSISYFSILLLFILLDAAWLGIMAKRFYEPSIGHLMTRTPAIIPAIVFYLLYAFAILFFVVTPSLTNNYEPLYIFAMGFVLGLAAYGTYDLTNLATLKSWPLLLSAIDMLWGSILTGITSVLATSVTRLFKT